MVIFNLKKEKREEPALVVVPDELPSLSEPEMVAPKPKEKLAPLAPPPLPSPPELPRLEPVARAVIPVAGPPPAQIPVQMNPPVAATPVFQQPVTPIEDSGPDSLMDHINLVDKLRRQEMDIEKEILRLGTALDKRKTELTAVRQELDVEVKLVRVELGLEPRYDHKEARDRPEQRFEHKPETRIAPEIRSIPRSQKTSKFLPSDKYFYFVDGARARNLQELLDKLRTVSDDVFSYHSNAEKNDFYFWVRDVFADEHLANLLKDASRAEMIRAVSEHVR